MFIASAEFRLTKSGADKLKPAERELLSYASMLVAFGKKKERVIYLNGNSARFLGIETSDRKCNEIHLTVC